MFVRAWLGSSVPWEQCPTFHEALLEVMGRVQGRTWWVTSYQKFAFLYSISYYEGTPGSPAYALRSVIITGPL